MGPIEASQSGKNICQGLEGHVLQEIHLLGFSNIDNPLAVENVSGVDELFFISGPWFPGPPGDMKLLSWDCQGLGSPEAVPILWNLVRFHNPDVVFLIETIATT